MKTVYICLLAVALLAVSGYAAQVPKIDIETLLNAYKNGDRPSVKSAIDFAAAVQEGGAAGRNLLAVTDRRTITGETISDRFCAMDDKNNCDYVSYALYLAALLVARFVLAILTLLAIPCFLCMRCCCNICGGRKPGWGICCSRDPETFPGYDNAHIWTMKGLVIGCVVACLILFTISLAGNVAVTKGITAVMDSVIDAGVEVLDAGESVAQALLDLPYTADSGAALQESVDAARDIEKTARDIKAQVLLYDGYRQDVTSAMLVLPMGFVLLGGILGLLHISFFETCIAMFVLFFCVFVWISAGVHDVVSTVTSDMCFEFDFYIDQYNKEGNANNAFLANALQCAAENSSVFEEFVNVYKKGIKEANAALCAILEDLCDPEIDSSITGYYNQSTTRCDLPCTGTKSFRNSSIQDPPYTGEFIKFEDCPTDCVTPRYQNLSAAIIVQVEIIEEYKRIFEEEILPLLNCDFILNLVDNIYEAVCEKFAVGLRDIKRASQLLAVACTIGAILLILGAKRFDPHYHVGEYTDRYSKDSGTEWTSSDDDGKVYGKSVSSDLSSYYEGTYDDSESYVSYDE